MRCFGQIAATLGLAVFVWAVGYGPLPTASPAEQPGRYQGPSALVASADGKLLYVANADAREVVWIELPSGKLIRRIALPAVPTGLALSPDGTRLIVTCAASRSTVAVFAAISGGPICMIPAGHTAMSPAISPDGKRLYVCNRFDNDVSVIDLAAGKQVARIPAVREPIAAAVTPDGQTVLVANHLPHTRTDDDFRGNVAPVVTVIDANTHQTTAIELPHGATGVRSLCISPDGGRALVTHLLANFQQIPFRVDTGWINVNVVSILDTRQRKLLSTIGMDEPDLGAGNPWDVIFALEGKSVCVSLAGTHELCVIDSAVLFGDSAWLMQPMMGAWPIYTSLGSSLWRRIELPGKGPRGLAAAGSKVYVAQYFSDSVAVVDPHAPDDAAVGSIALGPVPQLTQQRRGELLFHDATICYQHWQSCASCHPDGRTDGLNWDLINDGVGNPKNTKSLLWAHQTPPAMAQGVRMSAEEAVRSGVQNILFAERPEEEAAAIDAYLKSLRPVPSPYGPSQKTCNVGQVANLPETRQISNVGQVANLPESRQISNLPHRGRVLFQSERVGCFRCHPAPLYTDLKPHNVGSRHSSDSTDRFDTPTLIEAWRTAPYLHDGRYTTLKELLIQGKHGLGSDPGEALSDQDIDELVSFVLSL